MAELKIQELLQLIQFGVIERDVMLLVNIDGDKTTWYAKVTSLTAKETREVLSAISEYQHQVLVYESMYRQEMLARTIKSINGYVFTSLEESRNFFDNLQDQLVRFIFERCVDSIVKEQARITLEAYVAGGEDNANKTLQEIADDDIVNPGDVLKNLSEGDSKPVITELSSEDTINS